VEFTLIHDGSHPFPDDRVEVTIEDDGDPVVVRESSRLNLLVRTRSKLTDAGGWLRLAGIQPMVDSVLKITNLTRILPCYPSVDAARR